MDAKIDIKTLEEAVNVFYRSGAQQQLAAHDWLTKVQLSPQAWSFVWDLMQLGKVRRKKKLFFGFEKFSNLNSICFDFWRKDFGNSIFWSDNIAYEIIEALERSTERESR